MWPLNELKEESKIKVQESKKNGRENWESKRVGDRTE